MGHNAPKDDDTPSSLPFPAGRKTLTVEQKCFNRAREIDHPRQLMEISETEFWDPLTMHNDQISYLKHVLDPLYLFFTLCGCLVGGGGLLNDIMTS